MRTLLYFLLLIFSIKLNAHVGIYTPTPEATLEVVGKQNATIPNDGIVSNRSNGNPLVAKIYISINKGVMIFAFSQTSNPSGNVVHLSKPEIHYVEQILLLPLLNEMKSFENLRFLHLNNNHQTKPTLKVNTFAPLSHGRNSNSNSTTSHNYIESAQNLNVLKRDLPVGKLHTLASIKLPKYRSCNSVPSTGTPSAAFTTFSARSDVVLVKINCCIKKIHVTFLALPENLSTQIRQEVPLRYRNYNLPMVEFIGIPPG